MLGQRRSVDLDLAGTGLVDAVQDLEDRRFPGAILAKQGMNFAAPHVDADIVQGADAAEILGDTGAAEPRWTMVLCHRPWHWFSR